MRSSRIITATRLPLALVASALLGAGAIGCGAGTGTTTTSTASSTAARPNATATSATTVASSSPGGYLKNDGDADFDDTAHNRGNPEDDASSLFAPYGRRASPADARAVTALVKRYLTAAAAGDAASACSMLTVELIEGLLTEQGRPAGSPRERCAASMAPLLAQQHRQLVADDFPTLIVISVHVKGDVGVASLGSRTMTESSIRVEREGHAWKIDALFASPMP